MPLIQGTLRTSISSETLIAGSMNATVGEGYAFALSIAPVLHQSGVVGSDTIINENLVKPLMNKSVKPVRDGIREIIVGVKEAISYTTIDCDDVGRFDVRNDEDLTDVYMCPEPTVFAGGLYITDSDVAEWVHVSSEVRKMETALIQKDIKSAKNIYLHVSLPMAPQKM